MPQIKEIRKIESNIKEIKPEKKVESIDDEFEDEEEYDEIPLSFSSGVQLRRKTKTATLEAEDIPRTVEERQQSRTNTNENDRRSTVNFYSGGGGGNPYKSNAYTPVGSAESGLDNNGRRSLGQRDLDRGGDLERSTGMEQSRSDNGGMNYAGQSEQEKRDKRRNQL